eukprot:scaffold133571_cov33-Cyclotella_meneghiniana.AAC.3
MYEYPLHYVNLEREHCRLSLAYLNLSQPTAQSATSFAIAISADVEDSFNANASNTFKFNVSILDG